MGMRCNWQKNKIQSIGTRPAALPVQTDGQLVKPVTIFTYIDPIATSDGLVVSEVNNVTELASYILWVILVKSGDTKVSVWTRSCVSISVWSGRFFYGDQEDWRESLQAFHVIAQILQIKWNTFITNDSARKRTKLMPDLPLIIADRRHALLSHVRRLGDKPAHIALRHRDHVTLECRPTLICKAYITVAIRLRYDYDTTIPRRIRLRRKWSKLRFAFNSTAIRYD